MPISGKRIQRSVIFQVFLAMAVIAGMALASMSLSVYVTVSAQNDAEAINLAGSLRMHSYRISNYLGLASQARSDDVEQRLAAEMKQVTDKLNASIIPLVVNEANNVPLEKSYALVLSNWQQGMAPVIQSSLDGATSWQESHRRYNAGLDQWVDDIDAMVTHLQRDNEGKIELLGMTEAVSIILIIFIVLYLIMRADSNFVVPLRKLLKAAEAVERGNLGHRVTVYPENELGVLAASFNTMTASLEAQYRTLEKQVEERTRELHRSNQALYFLYKTSREVASSPYDERLLRVFLAELQKVSNVEKINLCVNAEPNYPNYEYLGTDTAATDYCDGDCNICALPPAQPANPHAPGLSLPIGSRSDNYGFLYVKPHNGEKLLPWQSQLLKTVAETLSTSFAFHRNLGQEHRLMLLEERSTIARELHDSLAQSLSYMKLETARLKKLISKDSQPHLIEEAIEDLQEGINAAYKHLRELLVTFRVKLDSPNLRSALEHAVQEFNELSAAEITLDYKIDGAGLGPNGDIHVLHVIREAINNAVKHAAAGRISLRCERNQNGDCIFTVDDDGVGIPERPEKAHHYGLYTMRERAQRLGGMLHFSVRDCGGTRVQLRVPTGTAKAIA
ncbi:histidine kinase [Pseudohalioglobus lutimaris]|uniref:Sensor protein n=1 Tax=Pseudohalioglobus lutimaris TaxID=1737061 RepID=A0A2N5X8E2_9GAMM|nr:histidine kinase [Pseudohalioglobus lutimaris]PLW70750.1 HAMP domain-containing protein [Pseudohalioglobus lutimaris]